jgi:hypothetical protein
VSYANERSLVRPTELAQLHQVAILRREGDLAPGCQQSSVRRLPDRLSMVSFMA